MLHTGKSLSEALIFASTNPQYDDILFIELQVQYMKISSSEHGENMLCTEIVFDIQNNLGTQYVLFMFCKNENFCQRFSCNFSGQKFCKRTDGIGIAKPYGFSGRNSSVLNTGNNALPRCSR